jgi:uncharacterized membrane protein
MTTPFLWVFKKPENVLFAAVLWGCALGASYLTYIDQMALDEGSVLAVATVLVLCYASLLYVLGHFFRRRSPWEGGARLLRFGSVGLAMVTLFVTTFEEYAKTVLDYRYTYTVLLGDQVTGSSELGWMVLSLGLNAVFIGFLSLMIFVAVRHEEFGAAFTVVRIFALYLLVKYFTLFYTMFDTGLFFMLGGLLFIVGGWILERNRAELLVLLGAPSASR